MPKKPGSHHVVPNADGCWDVKKMERPIAAATSI